MENQNITREESLRKKNPPDGTGTYGDFATLESSVLTEDPASYFIVSLVQVAEINKISELKAYFSNNEELESLVDPVLHRMEAADLIRINGDTITLSAKFIDGGSNPTELKRFLPNLFRMTVNRVLENESENPGLRKLRKEMVRWFSLPEDPEVAAEAHAIDLEYKAKMVALQERSLKKMKKGTGVRFVGIVDCILDSEDFG